MWKYDPRSEMGQRRKKGKRKKRNSHKVQRIREHLGHIYGKKCADCGVGETTSRLTIDHIWPRSEGGSWCHSNLQLLCWPCHVKKDSPITKRKISKLVLRIIAKWKVRL